MLSGLPSDKADNASIAPLRSAKASQDKDKASQDPNFASSARFYYDRTQIAER